MSFRRRWMLNPLWAMLSLLAILAVPTALTSASLRFATSSPALYEYGFDKYQVGLYVGMERAELSRVAREMIAYFNSREEFYQTEVVSFGQRRPLFNQREVIHLKDIQGLIQGVARANEASLAILIAYAAFSLGRQRDTAMATLARAALRGSVLTLAVFLALGLGSLVAFNWLFYLFHVLGFSNLFWQLDPAQDYLIRLFPQGFFYDATLMVFGATLAGAALLGAVSWLYLRRGRPGAKKEPQARPGALRTRG